MLKPSLLKKILTMGKTKAGFYAVARGRQVGIYNTWDDCKAQVNGFPSARYKKFPTSEEAKRFIEEHSDIRDSGSSSRSPNITDITTPTNSNPLPVPGHVGFICNRKAESLHSSTTTTATATTSFGIGTTSTTNFGMGATAATKLDFRTTTSTSGSCGRLLANQSTNSLFKKSDPSKAFAPAQKRTFSKASLKVTEDRVINKRSKVSTVPPNSLVDLSEFSTDEDGYVVVFTDGACTKNGRKAAKAGIGVWFGDDHHLNISEPVRGRQTNNTAEIQAAERAIKIAKENGINKLKVKTDSQFTINCVTKWIHNWRRNKWKLSSGTDVKNKEDLLKLDEAMQNMEIKWSYVAGHAGIEGNEAADKLAVAGAEKKSKV